MTKGYDREATKRKISNKFFGITKDEFLEERSKFYEIESPITPVRTRAMI